MEMRQLRYFAAVARTGSFSQAARECRVAQPSLSQQIINLEEEVGERLFERTQRKALLTAAGSLLLPHAREHPGSCQGRDSRKFARWADRSGERSSSVRCRLSPLIFCRRLFILFEKNIPHVELILHEDTTQQPRALEENELDLALISEAPGNPRIEIQPLFFEELFFVCRLRIRWSGASKCSPPICSTKNLF